MSATILDGYQLAEQHRQALEPQVEALLKQGKKLAIGAILFQEDAGSTLYTELKREMARSLGIGYQVESYSVLDDIQQVLQKIRELNQDPAITGIIIQKPWRKTWLKAHNLKGKQGREQFSAWWSQLVAALDPNKDVDGLHPDTLKAIQAGTWQQQGKVLPATCRGVLALLEQTCQTRQLFVYLRENKLKTVILGKSDLLGQPLFALLQSNKCSSEMIGSSELKQRIEQKMFLQDADIIVSATGRAGLITKELVKDGVIVIDAGEPKGDVDFEAVAERAKAITAVPGGVGPMTVISLMENAVDIV